MSTRPDPHASDDSRAGTAPKDVGAPSTKLSRQDIGSWLSGPGVSAPLLDPEGNPWAFRGERLGLPEEGVGSLATFGRRTVALLIDWLASLLLVRLFLPELVYGSSGSSLATMAFFATEVALFTWVAGSSFGQRIMGMQVVRLDGTSPGLLRAIGRTLLLCLVIPAVVWDRDGRGLHDRLMGTVLLRR